MSLFDPARLFEIFDAEDLPRPGDPPPSPEATMFNGQMLKIARARRAGLPEEVERLLGEIETFLSPAHRALAEKAIDAAERTERGERGPFNVGMSLPGQLLCDFCASPETVCYYPFAEFTLVSVGDWASGDRMYACAACRRHVDAGDWRGLRVHVGPTAASPGVKLLWAGFRLNRTTAEAVEFEPGTNPEEGRQDQQ